ncbi:uncharacterized protein METZ01_LOCUS386441 [marine metagenome]|uniref:Sulfotransferase domain-containing protein n=1 Tax=marine metagenome TaxID=408172 RepID=A0A382UHP5_9ZZZZ
MIIIAGLGHCGTSLLAGAFDGKHTFCRACPNKWSDLSLFKYPVIKTHSLPPTDWPPKSKAIWCFGNPMDIVISCRGDARHCQNLMGDYKHMDEIYDRDVMGLEKHFDVWYKQQQISFATVKYEKIFSNIKEIKRFMGLKMNFPEFVPRKTNWKKHWAAPWIQETYARLTEKIDAAEDFKIW